MQPRGLFDCRSVSVFCTGAANVSTCLFSEHILVSDCLWKLKYWPLFQFQNLFNTSQDLKSRGVWCKSIIHHCINSEDSSDWNSSLTATVGSPALQKEKGNFMFLWKISHEFESFEVHQGEGWGSFDRKRFHHQDLDDWQVCTDEVRMEIAFLQHLLSLFVKSGIFQSNTDPFVLFVLRQAMFAVCKNNSGWTHKGKPTFSLPSAMQENRTPKLEGERETVNQALVHDVPNVCCNWWLAINYFNVLLTQMIKKRKYHYIIHPLLIDV